MARTVKRSIDDYKDRMTIPIGIKVTTGKEEPEEDTVIVEGAIPFKPIIPEDIKRNDKK